MPRRRACASLLAAAVLTACTGGTDGTAGTAEPTGACAAEERPRLQSGSHLIGDAEPPVPYSSTPGTSGWHASGAPAIGVHDQPLTDPQLVAVLEAGQVAAVYDPDALPADEVAELEALAGTAHDGELTVAPYAGELPTPLTLTAWGVLQRCRTVDPDAVAAFVAANHGQVGDDH